MEVISTSQGHLQIQRFYSVIWTVYLSILIFKTFQNFLWFPVVLCYCVCINFYSFCSPNMKYPLCLSSFSTFRTSSPPRSLCFPLLYLFWSGLHATLVSFHHIMYTKISYLHMQVFNLANGSLRKLCCVHVYSLNA